MIRRLSICFGSIVLLGGAGHGAIAAVMVPQEESARDLARRIVEEILRVEERLHVADGAILPVDVEPRPGATVEEMDAQREEQEREELNRFRGRSPRYESLRERLVARPREELAALAADESQEGIVCWVARMALDRQERPEIYDALRDFRVPASSTTGPARRHHIAASIVSAPLEGRTGPDYLMGWLELCLWPGWQKVRHHALLTLRLTLDPRSHIAGAWALGEEQLSDLVTVMGFLGDHPLLAGQSGTYDVAGTLAQFVEPEAFHELARLWRQWRLLNEGRPFVTPEQIEERRNRQGDDFEQSMRDGNPALQSVATDPRWDEFVDAFAQTPEAAGYREYIDAVLDLRGRREEYQWGSWRYKTAEELAREVRIMTAYGELEEFLRAMPKSILRRIRDRFPESVHPLVDQILAEER